MMRSLYAGVSGLQNHQTRMDVIGNNISKDIVFVCASEVITNRHLTKTFFPPTMLMPCRRDC